MYSLISASIRWLKLPWTRKWPSPQKGVIGKPIKRKCHAGNCILQCESSTHGALHWIQWRGDNSMWHWSLCPFMSSFSRTLLIYAFLFFSHPIWSYWLFNIVARNLSFTFLLHFFYTHLQKLSPYLLKCLLQRWGPRLRQLTVSCCLHSDFGT